MGRKVNRKRTRKTKRVESFTQTHGMAPSDLLGKLDSCKLPDSLRKKVIIKEARELK